MGVREMICEICKKDTSQDSDTWDIVIQHYFNNIRTLNIRRNYCNRCIGALLKHNESLKVNLRDRANGK